MRTTVFILCTTSASALRLVKEPDFGCKYSPWECNDSEEFVDDQNRIAGTAFAKTKLHLDTLPEYKGDSTFVCPNFVNPDISLVEDRTTKGLVTARVPTQSQDHTYLFILMSPFTGSTAVSSLLATSPKVSTLCDAGTWACEGTWILQKDKFFASNERWMPDLPKDWNEAVGVYSKTWDTSQPVLMDKSPPNIAKAARIYDQLTAAGKKARFIMVTRSPCFAQKSADKDWMQMLLQARNYLPSEALLHLQYEELLQDPYGSVSKMLEFLPELESIDPAKYGLTRSFNKRNLSITEYISTRKTFANENAGKHANKDWEPFLEAFGYGK